MKNLLSRNRSLFLIAFLVLCGAAAWVLVNKSAPEESPKAVSTTNPKSDRGELGGGDSASKGLVTEKQAAAAAESGSRVENALLAAQKIAARPTGQAEFDVFNKWVPRYLAAPENEKGEMLVEGIAFATARRATLASLIQRDPRRAIENAVPPVVRQELPMAVVTQLEERVNEQAFFGVLGVVPQPDAVETPA